jgi:hypothetical protein
MCRFQGLYIIKGRLPKDDLIICRDGLVHLTERKKKIIKGYVVSNTSFKWRGPVLACQLCKNISAKREDDAVSHEITYPQSGHPAGQVPRAEFSN